MPSPSMSGVSVLLTSMPEISSDGITSSATWRASFSADGTRTPPMLTALRLGSMPRTTMKRPSPWSRAIDTPGRRCTASVTFWSGNWPMPSADTTLRKLSALRCWLIADAWPAA